MLSLRRGVIVACIVGCSLLASRSLSINIQLQEAQTGLNEPILATNTGVVGDTRLFICQHAGRIRISNAGALNPADFINLGGTGLNLCSNASGGDERGLLGLVFHPNYASNRLFYVCYTRASDGHEIVDRFQTQAENPNLADTTTQLNLIDWPDPQNNHNGGMLAFGQDGYLYISFGDGGNGDDMGAGHNPTIGNGQDTTQLLGKMLRIDINSTEPPTYPNYAIPATNPFASSAGSEKKEIYAYGFRNPWRYSFDRLNGRLMLGDVGQGAREEIDIINIGNNYGWFITEGTICRPPTTGCDTTGLTPPVFEYTHSTGRCSITGGYVYRGAAYPSLNGLYFYADYCTGEIWTLEEGPSNTWTNVLRLDAAFNISSFGEDINGEVYVCGINNGVVYKITDADLATPTATPSLTASPSPTPAQTPTATPLPGAEIDVTPLVLAFGNKVISAGATSDKTVTIMNLGSVTLTISSVSIVGANAADFTIFADTNQMNLAPNATRAVRIVFDPNDPPGPKTANLHIVSNDADESVVDVLLTGTGLTSNPKQIFGYYPANDHGRGHAYFVDKAPPLGVRSYKIEVRRVNVGGVFQEGTINLAGVPTGDVTGVLEFNLPLNDALAPTSFEIDLQFRFIAYDALNALGNILFQSDFGFGTHPSADVKSVVFTAPPFTGGTNEPMALTDHRPTGSISTYAYDILRILRPSGTQSFVSSFNHGLTGPFRTIDVHPETVVNQNVSVVSGKQDFLSRVRRQYNSAVGTSIGRFDVAHPSSVASVTAP